MGPSVKPRAGPTKCTTLPCAQGGGAHTNFSDRPEDGEHVLDVAELGAVVVPVCVGGWEDV